MRLSGQSISTPTIVGSDIYQYTYSGGTGTLYDVHMPALDPTAVLKRYGARLPSYLTVQPTILHTLTFHPTEGAYGADAQDSLTTAEGWQAIAVGHEIYAWPQGEWPTAQSAVPRTWSILGTPGNSAYQVDMGVLITSPVRVRVYSVAARHVVSVSAPMAVAASWDGGARAVALLPEGDYPLTMAAYAAPKSDAPAAITSDPVFIPSEPLFSGDPAAAFGVASSRRPRVELLDLETGQAKAIGTGEILYPVADAGMRVSADGHSYLVYHDSHDDVYAWTLRGQLIAMQPSHSATIYMGVDGSQTYAGLRGALAEVLQPTQGGSQVATVPLPTSVDHASGAYIGLVGASSPSTVLGSASAASAPWCQGSGTSTEACRYVTALTYQGNASGGPPGILLLSAAAGGPAYIHDGIVADAGQLIAARTDPYVGALLDAGPQHDIVSWTNDAPGGGGAVELWAPVRYALEAQAPPTVPSSDQVTVTGTPIPAGVTHDRLPWAPCAADSSESPVMVDLQSALGFSGYVPLSLTRQATPADPWETWTGQWQLPPNTTGEPVTWTGQVSATDKFCTTATATVTFTEEPSSPAPQASGVLALSPDPVLYGQTVSASLQPVTPAAPTPPKGKVTAWTWRLASAELFWPKVDSRWTFSVPYYPINYGRSAAMALGQHSATLQFPEDWWDGGGATLAGINVPILSDAGSWTPGAVVPNGQPIPSLSSPVKAVYSITESFSYSWTTTSTEWRPNPACSTSAPPKTCNAQGETPVPVLVHHTASATITLPQQTAQAQITVDGSALDRVGGGG